MPHRVRVADLLSTLAGRLQLTLLAGEEGLEQPLLGDLDDPARNSVVGPLNFIHRNRIQVLGRAEMAYLADLERNRDLALGRLFKPALTTAVVLVDDIPADDALLQHARDSHIPLIASPLADKEVLDHLQHFAALHLSGRIILHGVFLEVQGMGVLLTGEPAVGKSELALELISRGNRLIADDAPEFSRTAPDSVLGECPPLLREFLEVRGLGVLNIRAMFGDNAIKRQKHLRLIVHLKHMRESEIAAMERLKPMADERDVLGIGIARVTIPVAPGRNLAILVESAVRNHLMIQKGYDANQDFIERQQAALRLPG